MPARIAVDQKELEIFCRRHGIRRLAFFGSVLRDDFRADSDIDVLYEFLPGYEPGWAIESVENDLSHLLGRKVDLVPLKYLNHRIRDRILSEAEMQYAV
jgi:uncharacterized protein